MSPIALTFGDVARELGCDTWHLQRIFERDAKKGALPTPGRVGIYRVVRPSDMPAIARALREAGYLPAVEKKAATA
jgi:hypothetical protein